MSQELSDRVSRSEEKLKSHERRIEKVESSNDAITRLTVLFENQSQKMDERDSQHQKQLDKFAETMDNVNENLSSLNATQRQLQEEVSHIGNRMEEVEKQADERKLDMGKLFKDVVYKVVPSVILAYIIFKFGL